MRISGKFSKNFRKLMKFSENSWKLQDRARPEREQEATVLSSSVRPTDGG
jgi:hypothetical protein